MKCPKCNSDDIFHISREKAKCQDCFEEFYKDIAIYIFIGFIILLIFALGYGYGIIIDKNYGYDAKFKCNPHYFGAKYTYPNVCPNSFINATGNYCNGVLVCENEVKK